MVATMQFKPSIVPFREKNEGKLSIFREECYFCNMPEKRLYKYLTVVLFALLHGLLAEVSILIGFNIVLILTMLTMLMSVSLSVQQKMGLWFMVAAVVIINFAGLWLGNQMGVFVRRYLITEACPHRHYLAGPMATTLTTCILGIAQIELAFLFRKIPSYREKEGNPLVLVLVFAVLLGVRMAMMLRPTEDFWYDNVALNIILNYVCSMALVLWMAYYTLHAHRDFLSEKMKRHRAQYSYDRLKHQVEPHFLFNSLNTLGNIVCNGQNQEAMDYIRKLSSVYRYLIENAEEQFIYLSDELAFVQEYVDLMKIRFPKGLDIRIDVDEKCRCCRVIPCALQLLVENAVKHNAISASNPQVISVSIQGNYLITRNNLNPKASAQPSTGNGLRYIRNRYLNETGKEIVQEQAAGYYTVKLPLL